MELHGNRLESRFQMLRLNTVVAMTMAFTVFYIVTVVIDPPPALFMLLRSPKTWVAGLTLGALITCVLWPHTVRTATVILLSLTIIGLPLEVRWHVDQGLLPLSLFLWLGAYMLMSHVVLGTRTGAAMNAVGVVVMVVSLVPAPPTDPTQVAAWLTGMIVLGLLGFMGYTVVGFVEDNLLHHAENHARLRAARLDALTGVYGRGAIEEELARALTHARHAGLPVSIVVVDVDHFKKINDQHGHKTGDDVLRAVAKNLRRQVGGMGGVVGRWGGEEFLLLLPGIARTDALVMAEQLRRHISRTPLAGLTVTASFGVSACRGPADTAEQMFSRADAAMYQAKAAGRNSVR